MEEREFWQIRADVNALMEWREDIDAERNEFRQSWSGEDVKRLRILLNGAYNQQAVSTFFDSMFGRITAGAIVVATVGGFLLQVWQVIGK